MNFSINSRKLGKTFSFTRPGSTYIFVNGRQICNGGSYAGNTLEYRGEDEDQFRAVCKNWYRSYMNIQNEMGLI